MDDELPVVHESEDAATKAERMEKALVLRQARDFAKQYCNDPDGPKDWPTRVFAIILAQTGDKKKAVEAYKQLKDYHLQRVAYDERTGEATLKIAANSKYQNRVARWRRSCELEALPEVQAFIQKIRQERVMLQTTNEAEIRGMLVNEMRGNLRRCYEIIPGKDGEPGKAVFNPDQMDLADWATVKRLRQRTRTYTMGKKDKEKTVTEVDVELELHNPQTAKQMLMEHMGMTGKQQEPAIEAENLTIMLFGEPKSKYVESHEKVKERLPDAIPEE